MSRRHWRFVVRDRYGYTIQNAKVNVYQPGTSNAFIGTAYNAASGGSTITNPFTTNAQGEVEGWFDTEQIVDVQVDDNVDTAYRAVDGSGVPISFTTFTEVDEIDVSPADVVTDTEHHVVGTTTDLQDITAAAQSEVAGATGRWMDAGHIHGHTAFADNPHGASQHTDITRSIWLDAESATVDVTALANIGTTPNFVRVQPVADATPAGLVWAFAVPDDWASGVLTAQIFYAPGATLSANVRFQLVAKSVAAGSDVTAAGTTTAFTETGASQAANALVKSAATSTGVTPAAVGDLFELNARRLGTDGADTFTGVINIIGVLITYTANQ